jgi:ABC-type multidrug transport system ATPase subunit
MATRLLHVAKLPLRLAAAAHRLATRTPRADVRPLAVLDRVSGTIPAGSMTLVLAPPGHSKSVLLRALAQRLPKERLTGRLAYSGKSPEEVAAAGINLRSLLGYVDQLDIHLGQLTVRETLAFAHKNACVASALAGDAGAVAAAEGRVEEVITMLGLGGVANSLIGDEMTRGISGGEKKRVTVGECMEGRAPLRSTTGAT